MREEAAPVQLGLHTRVRHGMRRPANWFQLVRFGLVGGSGYVVNLLTFAVCVHALSIGFRLAAVAAFLVAVTNNFLLNRHWTFDAAHGHAGHQGARFLFVSTFAFGFNFLVLELLVTVAGMSEVPAQALAVLAATPLNFVGNKLWSFRA